MINMLIVFTKVAKRE